jgi:dihydroflavonol-4-reductase
LEVKPLQVLVTGSTGFIGSNLCRGLLAQGHQVRAFHRQASRLTPLEGLEVEHTIGDITQPDTLIKAMQGIEVVFHAAAQVGAPRDLREMYAVTVGGTRKVLEAALKAGVRRVVHTSSVAALGIPEQAQRGFDRTGEATNPSLIMDERHSWNTPPDWWFYGHAKHLAEMQVQKAVAQCQDVVIVNPTVVIGAGDINRVSGDVVVHAAQGHIPVAIPGGLNIVHIADVVRGHLAAMADGRTGERYILGGENMTHQRFLQILAEVVGVNPPRFVVPFSLARLLVRPMSLIWKLLPLPLSGDDLRRIGYYFYYDTLKARLELGLKETLPVYQAVTDAFTWYREQGVV